MNLATRTITFHTPAGDLVYDASAWQGSALWSVPKAVLREVADAYGVDPDATVGLICDSSRPAPEYAPNPEHVFTSRVFRFGLSLGRKIDGVLHCGREHIWLEYTEHTDFRPVFAEMEARKAARKGVPGARPRP
jgi:hypothetical protein